MSEDAQEWRWVSEEGVEKAATEQELIAELSSETLPHYTLVWKRGWLEWLPAMRVAELAWALPPGKAERAMKPREGASAAQPPSPPLYLYPVLKRRMSLPAEEDDGEPLAHASPGATQVKREPRRAPSPDDEVTLIADGGLVDDDDTAFRNVGPTKRAIGARAYSEEDDGDTHVLASRPPPGPVYVAPHAPPQSERPAPSYDEEDIPVIPRPPPPPSDLSNYTRFSPTSEMELEQPIPRPKRSTRNVALACGAAALGVGAALLVLRGLGAGSADDDAKATKPGASGASAVSPATAVAPAEEPLRGAPCTVVTPALRLSEWAEPLIPPLFAPIPGSARVAVGFAQSDTYAVGLTIDPRTLDRDQVFREFRREKLVSVVPTSGSGKLHFEIVRQNDPLASARAVDGPSPFVIGITPFAIARLQKNEPVPLWPLADVDQGALPRVVALPNRGYAVAVRRAGRSGAIAVGYLDEDGNKKTALVEVRADGGTPGTPALAASETSLLVAFATRSGSQASWSIAGGVSTLGESPRRATTLAVRGGGPGADRSAPAVGALGGGRWLLQWTEGSGKNRVARAEVFDQKLAPLNAATNLSPEGASAGPGVVWTKGDLATILFFVRNDKNNTNALWGVSLECPRSS
ncbi:MAG TPA: hypothetical protein VHC69_23305 [Polyangiaceae bacterium]|nr:hypothetical protein [Polyangiaceae bacterium]